MDLLDDRWFKPASALNQAGTTTVVAVRTLSRGSLRQRQGLLTIGGDDGLVAVVVT